MNYLISLVFLSGLVLFLVKRKRYMLRRNFDRYLDMHVSVLLAKERSGSHRMHGSLILELEEYAPELRSVYVSQLKSKSKDIHIKYFNSLLFEINTPGKIDTKLLSIGIRMSDGETERACKDHKEYIYVGGKLYLSDKQVIPFGKYLCIRALR